MLGLVPSADALKKRWVTAVHWDIAMEGTQRYKQILTMACDPNRAVQEHKTLASVHRENDFPRHLWPVAHTECFCRVSSGL